MIEIVLRPGSIEIRFGARRGLLGWWRRRVEAWREERDARQLAQLDARLLNDLGLGTSAGHPTAARIHAYRQHESRRQAMARLGLM